MALEGWLKRAGLTGKKLEQAVDGCRNNTVETVADLRELAEDVTEFRQAFPQAMVRKAISKALEASKDDDATEQTNAPDLPKKTVEKGDENKAPELPVERTYHYFASHRKRHSIHGNLSETQAIMTKVILQGS